MRLVRIQDVHDGMELARDIPAATLGSAPLLRRGIRLTASLASRLGPHGVRAVWVEDDLGEGVVPFTPLTEEIRRATEHAVVRCHNEAREPVGRLSADALAQLESAALAVLHALEDCPEAAVAFDDLAAAESYTYGHSIRVTTLGLLVAQRIARLDGWVDWEGNRRFDSPPARMAEMAMGLLIHDIGKVAIPETVLNKPAALSAEEWKLVRTHPSAGASLLAADRVSALTICIVRDHHERWDGAGYEQGRVGLQTHQFARIAAVADVYDAITADRPYKAATAPHVAVRTIRRGAGTQFDPDVVRHFRRIAMPYPVAYTLDLPGGQSGVVIRVDPHAPEDPVVRFRDPSGRIIEATVHVVDGVVQESDVVGLYN